MKRKIILLAVLLAVTSVAAIAVAIKTSCGLWTYALSREEFNSWDGGDDPLTYDEYLMIINEDKCGEYTLPRVVEEGDKHMGID